MPRPSLQLPRELASPSRHSRYHSKLLLPKLTSRYASSRVKPPAVLTTAKHSRDNTCQNITHSTQRAHSSSSSKPGRKSERSYAILPLGLTGTSIPSSSPIPHKHSQKRVTPHFQTGYSLYRKRDPKPFPKPWINPPTTSFSEPLTLHPSSYHRRPKHGHIYSYPQSSSPSPDGLFAAEGPIYPSRFLRGYTNGDDALLVSATYLAVADGVGSWNTKDRGYPALWSRLLCHYFSIACDRFINRRKKDVRQGEGVDMLGLLEAAFRGVVKATAVVEDEGGKGEVVMPPTSESQRYRGTTTFTGCLLHEGRLHVVSLGDSHLLVLRPGYTPAGDDEGDYGQFLLKTEEQWHWFDCPRQLGTDSPDLPRKEAVTYDIEVQNGDIIILASDGLLDNIWGVEVVDLVYKSLGLQPPSSMGGGQDTTVADLIGQYGADVGVDVAFKGREWDEREGEEMMTALAAELVKAAKMVATDPYAGSPWLERAIEAGKVVQSGGKVDDVTVVVGRVGGLQGGE